MLPYTQIYNGSMIMTESGFSLRTCFRHNQCNYGWYMGKVQSKLSRWLKFIDYTMRKCRRLLRNGHGLGVYNNVVRIIRNAHRREKTTTHAQTNSETLLVIMVFKRKIWYGPYPLLSEFPWLCAWGVCYIIFCHLLHIHSGKTGILFSLLLCSLWWVQIVGYALACRSHSFVCTLHHIISIIVQTYLKTLNL